MILPATLYLLQEEEKRLRSYDSLFDESKMASNSEVAASEDASASIAFEDDFMVRGNGVHSVWQL